MAEAKRSVGADLTIVFEEQDPRAYIHADKVILPLLRVDQSSGIRVSTITDTDDPFARMLLSPTKSPTFKMDKNADMLERFIERCPTSSCAQRAHWTLLLTVRYAYAAGYKPFARHLAVRPCDDVLERLCSEVPLFSDWIPLTSSWLRAIGERVERACCALKLCSLEDARQWFETLFGEDRGVYAPLSVAFLVNANTMLPDTLDERFAATVSCDRARSRWIVHYCLDSSAAWKQEHTLTAARLQSMFPTLYHTPLSYSRLADALACQRYSALFDLLLHAIESDADADADADAGRDSTAMQAWKTCCAQIDESGNTDLWHAILCVGLPPWRLLTVTVADTDTNQVSERVAMEVEEAADANVSCAHTDEPQPGFLREWIVKRVLTRVRRLVPDLSDEEKVYLDDWLQPDFLTGAHEWLPGAFLCALRRFPGAWSGIQSLETLSAAHQAAVEHYLVPLCQGQQLFLARFWHLLYATSTYASANDWTTHYFDFIRHADPMYAYFGVARSEQRLAVLRERAMRPRLRPQQETTSASSESMDVAAATTTTEASLPPCMWCARNPRAFLIEDSQRALLRDLLCWHSDASRDEWRDEWRYDLYAFHLKREGGDGAAFLSDAYLHAAHYIQSITTVRRSMEGFVPNNPAVYRDL